MTFRELCDVCYKHNEENHITRQYDDPKPLKCFVRFKQMPSWNKQYNADERTYEFSSAEKYFIGGLCGSSIFGHCVGYEEHIRLDYYLHEWEIEDCWYEETNGKD